VQRAARNPRRRDRADVRRSRAGAGMRVLDVAAGTGDQSILAAQRIGTSGSLLATDISASMLDVAAQAARDAGLSNVETHVSDASALDLPRDTFDAAICRFGLMFVPDLHQALVRVHHALKPGARFRRARLVDPRCQPLYRAPD